jgi:heptosyltransferase-2
LKILIVKIGALGDVVMSLAMLKEIDRQWPGAQIAWVCGEGAAPLVEAVRRVDEIIVVNDQKLLKGGLPGALGALIPLWFRFLGKSFDLIVTGHSDPRYGWLSLTAHGKIRRQFGEGKEGRWPVPGRYHADEYVRLITGQNGPQAVLGRVPTLSLPLTQALSEKIVSGKKVVALAPGGAKNILRDDALRRWPLDHYARLAKKLLEKDYQVVITGSSADDGIRDSFKQLPVLDLVGQTSVTDLIALYGRTDLVITHDSGPLHLAIASGKPVMGLFGPTNPWEKVPRDEKVKILWGGENLACRPCYDGKNYTVCPANECLRGVSVDQVYAEIEKILKS